MKPLGIIILGCLPLAVLTLWSFVELRGIESHPRPAGKDPAMGAELAEQARKLAADEKAAADRLAGADFLAGEALPSLGKVPADSDFHPAAETWPRWTTARQMLQAFLEVQRLTATTDAQRLREAVRQFEKLKETYTTLDGRLVARIRQADRRPDRRAEPVDPARHPADGQPTCG